MTHFPIKDLKRADYNPRIMPDSEMNALIQSIETHGFVEPIVVNINKDRYGIIVGGHQRLAAVERLIAKGGVPQGIIFDMKAEDEKHENMGFGIPCFTVDLSEEAEKQLNLGLNKISGKFDQDKLFDIIFQLKDSVAVGSTGFSADEIAGILDKGDTHESKKPHGCDRCIELEKSISGHMRRSGHTIEIKKENE